MDTPQGRLFIIGGAERKRANKTERSLHEKLKVLGRMLEEAKGVDTHIEIIATASAIPNIIAPEYVKVFEDMGCTNAQIMPIRSRKHADKTDFLARLRTADLVLFTGGDQSKIARAFLDSEFLRIMKYRYQTDPNFMIAGTSAGAMMMSEVMIFGGQPLEALLTAAPNLSTGLGLMTNTIIDSHFVERGRFGRLAAAVAHYPHLLGIGLSEDTAILVSQQRFIEVIGSGLVCLYGAKELGYNSLQTDQPKPLAFENMHFHLLAQGLQFDIAAQRVLVTANVV